MNDHLTRLFKTYDFHNALAFFESLVPSTRYGWSVLLMGCSALFSAIDKVFGLDAAAFIGLAFVFAVELISGMYAAHIRGEAISSVKLSRFGLKVTCYLVMIASTYLMAVSFTSHKKDVPAWVFNWLNVFLVSQIVLENIISVLENLAVISGKDKSAWIIKIQEKFKALIG